MSSKTNVRYNCNGQLAKPPEGGAIKCPSASSWIVTENTKCTITCETGNPSEQSIQCKAKGWRPTNKVTCDGVAPGVIVGILIAGIAAVVLIAIGYAKYKQHQKKKLKALNPSSNNSHSRPGRSVVVGPDVGSHSSGGSSGYDGPASHNQKRSHLHNGHYPTHPTVNNGSNGKSYHGSERRADAGRRPSHNAGSVHQDRQYPPQVPRHSRVGRYSDQSSQHGYGAAPHHELPPYAASSYPAVGYGSAQPAVGYKGYAAPAYHVAARPDYGRPYHVPT